MLIRNFARRCLTTSSRAESKGTTPLFLTEYGSHICIALNVATATTMTLHEDLLDLHIPESLRISPDQKSIVYSTSLPANNRTGDYAVSTIWLAAVGKSGSARQLTNGLSEDREPNWSPAGSSIAFVSDRSKPGKSSAIYILPIDGGDPYPVTPANNQQSIDGFQFSPDGKTIAFISADEKSEEKKAKEKAKDDAEVWGHDWPWNRLRLVDVATSTVTTLVSIDAHILELAWNDSGTKIAFATVRSPDPESCDVYGTTFSSVNVADAVTVQLCHFPTYIGNMVNSGGRIYFIGQASEDNLISAKMVFVIDPDHEPTIFEKHAYGLENCALLLAKTGSSVIVEVEHGMESQLRILNGETLFSEKKELRGWDVACMDESDEAVVAIALTSTNKPCEIYSITGSSGELVQLSEHGRSIADQKFSSSTFLSCPSSDNEVTLDAVWHVPPGFEEGTGPLPTVVFIHGGPYGRHTDRFDDTYFMWGPLIRSLGFAMLTPNYRGGSSRGDRFAAYARGVGKYDYEDIITLTQHAIEKGYADRNRLIVAGWSNGGFLSYLCSVRNGLHGHGWKFQAAIPGAGVSDMDTATLTTDMGIWKGAVAGKQPWLSEKSDTRNRQSSAIWEFHSAIKHGGVIPPMLILHGEQDKRVPLEQARGMRRALQSAGLPYEFVVYPREGHVISERQHLIDMGERVLRFVETHIGQGSR